MKKETFYRKYSNMPVPNRFFQIVGTAEKQYADSKSPREIYVEMIDLDNAIAKAKARQEELLEIAERILK